MTPRVTVTVVSYNDNATIENCVASLVRTLDCNILGVDNCSTDDTWRTLKRLEGRIDRLTVIRAPSNGGYASAVNIARRNVDTEYLAVVNADCVSSGDWTAIVVAYLDDHPRSAAASPTVVLLSGYELNAEGLDLHVTGFGFNRNLHTPTADSSQAASIVPGVQGTAFVIRVSALDRIGGWYEGGFLYHEDVELSWALRLAGFTINHVPTPPIFHDYTLTMSAEKFFLLERNRLEMLSADLGPITKTLLLPALLASEVAVWAYAIRKGRALIAAKLNSYRSIWRRREERKLRRSQVRHFREVSDRELLKSMHWKYPRTQTTKLHKEDLSTGRRHDRDMPTS